MNLLIPSRLDLLVCTSSCCSPARSSFPVSFVVFRGALQVVGVVQLGEGLVGALALARDGIQPRRPDVEAVQLGSDGHQLGVQEPACDGVLVGVVPRPEQLVRCQVVDAGFSRVVLLQWADADLIHQSAEALDGQALRLFLRRATRRGRGGVDRLLRVARALEDGAIERVRRAEQPKAGDVHVVRADLVALVEGKDPLYGEEPARDVDDRFPSPGVPDVKLTRPRNLPVLGVAGDVEVRVLGDDGLPVGREPSFNAGEEVVESRQGEIQSVVEDACPTTLSHLTCQQGVADAEGVKVLEGALGIRESSGRVDAAARGLGEQPLVENARRHPGQRFRRVRGPFQNRFGHLKHLFALSALPVHRLLLHNRLLRRHRLGIRQSASLRRTRCGKV